MCPIYGCPENFQESLSTPTATFPEILLAFVPIDSMNVRTKFEVRIFIRSCGQCEQVLKLFGREIMFEVRTYFNLCDHGT